MSTEILRFEGRMRRAERAREKLISARQEDRVPEGLENKTDEIIARIGGILDFIDGGNRSETYIPEASPQVPVHQNGHEKGVVVDFSKSPSPA